MPPTPVTQAGGQPAGDLASLIALVTDVKNEFQKADADVTVKLADLQKLHNTTDAYIKNVEDRVAKAERAGLSSPGLSEVQPIKSAIPERHRKALENMCRFERDERKAVRMVAMESWLKNSIMLCNPAVAARAAGPLLDEMEKIERSFGFEPVGFNMKALGTTIGAEGGYLVPVPLEAEVLRQIEDASVMRSLVRVFPMIAAEHLFPNLDTNITVGIVGEALTIPTVSPTFGQRALKARMFAVRAITPIQLVADAAVGVMTLLTELMSEKYALKEDQQILEGTGASEEFVGAVSAADVNEVTNGTNGDLFTPAKAQDQKWKGRKQGTRRGAAWVGAPEILQQIEKFRVDAITAADKAGAFLYTPFMGGPNAGGIVGTGQGPSPDGVLHGFPIYAHSEIKVDRVVGSATNCSNMYFGPWMTSVILGDLLGLQFGVSEHTNWATGQLDLRMLKRTAALVSVPKNLTKQTGLKIA